MNLRHLLLQFEGKRERLLDLEDSISESILDIQVEEDTNGQIEILVEDKDKIDDIIDSLKKILEKRKIEDYSISKIEEEDSIIVLEI